MSNHLLDGLLVVALIVLAVVLVLNERRAAARAGRRPCTALYIVCATFGAFAVVVGASLLLLGS